MYVRPAPSIYMLVHKTRGGKEFMWGRYWLLKSRVDFVLENPICAASETNPLFKRLTDGLVVFQSNFALGARLLAGIETAGLRDFDKTHPFEGMP